MVVILVLILSTTTAVFCQGVSNPADSAVQRGEYIFKASGGCSCHTDVSNNGAFMAGGRPMTTPFGTIYSTNITPDPNTGIGNWSDDEFIRAMRDGVSPDGSYYYPAFPFTSFTQMTDEDLLDMKAYLSSIPAVEQENQSPEMRFPYSFRSALLVWRQMYFTPGVFKPVSSRSDQWNRGAYLTNAVAHCGECHTPRDSLGGLRKEMRFAGARDGAEGEIAPNITPDPETGIGDWSVTDITWFLQTGFDPEGNDVQGVMRELIDSGYHQLTASDLEAIATYLKSLDPIENRVE